MPLESCGKPMTIYEYAKKEFEKLYDSRLTVFESKPIKVGAVTKATWVPVSVNELCRISQKQLSPTSEGVFAKVSYLTTLYCDPSLEIKASSRLRITDAQGVSREYKRSSEGFASYRTHQEIIIVRDVKA